MPKKKNKGVTIIPGIGGKPLISVPNLAFLQAWLKQGMNGVDDESTRRKKRSRK